MSTQNDWPTANDLPDVGDGGFGDGFEPAADGFDDWDVGDVDGNSVGSGRLEVENEGWYHFSIKAIAKPERHDPNNLSKQRKPSIAVIHTVAREANGTPAGSVLYHDLILGGKGGGPIDKWDKERTLNYLVGVGILKVDGGKVIDPETGTPSISVSPRHKPQLGKDGRPLIGNDGKPLMMFDGSGNPVMTQSIDDRLNKLGHIIGKLVRTKAKLKEQKDENGQPVLGADGKPLLMLDGDGKPIVQYPAKTEFSFGRGAYHPEAKEVAAIPADEAALAAAGFKRPSRAANA